MSVAMSGLRKDRIGRFARAALKQALGVVTGDRRLEAEGAAEQAGERVAADPVGAARPGRRGGFGGRSLAGKRDAR